jgi:hypothetical protein
VPYLDDIGASVVLGADAGDRDGLAQSLDERVLQAVDLLKVRVKVRHVVAWAVEVGPDGVR